MFWFVESDDEGEYGDLVELLNLSTALQSLSLDTICTPNRLTQVCMCIYVSEIL